MPPTPRQIQQAAASAGIDRPFYATEIKGEMILFHLYGGQDITVPIPSEAEGPTRAEPVMTPGRVVTAIGDLSTMTAEELKRLAALYSVSGRTRMNKAQLVEALGIAIKIFEPRKRQR